MPINKLLCFGDFFVLPGALAVFAWLGFRSAGLAAAPEFFIGLASGYCLWTLAEYWIHRVLYHRAPYLSDLHGLHHKTPQAFIGLPSFLSAGLVVLLTYAPAVVFSPPFADGFASGALVGYFAYMLTHHAVHHWRIEPGDWLYPARLRHLAHHRDDDSDFGIVTGAWDRIFGTEGRRRNRSMRV